MGGVPMKKVLAVLCTATAILTTSALPAHAQVSDAALALRWAPVHFQDTNGADADADYLTAVDYDGEWNTLNNWEHQDDSLARLKGAVYASVVETSTHWFIVYAFYHPRDWSRWGCIGGEHENDLEGVLLTVRRDGSTYGRLEAMVTVAHSDFYSFTPAGSPYTGGRENIDGPVLLQNGRPTTRQEAEGHGAKAWDGKEFPGGDGVVYQPHATTAEVPSSGNDRDVKYLVRDVFSTGGMWDRRANGETFASPGTFRGDNCKANAANAPWGWDDHDDGSDLPRGLLATDPAKLVAAYFANRGSFSLTYTRNRYRT